MRPHGEHWAGPTPSRPKLLEIAQTAAQMARAAAKVAGAARKSSPGEGRVIVLATGDADTCAGLATRGRSRNARATFAEAIWG